MENALTNFEFANGECPYKGCKLNENGLCISDDINFLWSRIDDLNPFIIGKPTEEKYFYCDIQDVESGYCEFCGRKLKKIIQIYDKKYGNKYEWICPNCGR